MAGLTPAENRRAAPARPCPGWLYGFSWLAAGATFLLVIAGGQVTSTDSGDAVPTWPFPITLPMQGGVLFELGHRQVAAAVGLLTLLLFAAVLLKRSCLPGSAVRAAAWALALVVVQALLGGVRVIAGERLGTSESPVITAIGIGHALLGQTFFCVLAGLVYVLGSRTPSGYSLAIPAAEAGRFNRSALAACGALYLQLILGAILRLTRPGPVAVLVLLHLAGAAAVIFAVLEVRFRIFNLFKHSIKHPEKYADLFIMRLVKVELALLGLQLLLGFAAYFAVKSLPGPASPEITWKTVVPTLHTGAGALLLMTAVLMALSARGLKEAVAPVSGGAGP